MRRFLIPLLTALSLASCQTPDEALTTNSDPVAFNRKTAGAIAGDMASRLTEQIGPAGPTTIKMEKDTSEYAAALEAALKGWGYTVIVDGKAAKDQKPLELAWSVDNFDGQILARLTTPSIALGRAYTPTAAGATPASPLSIMQRN
ncbi:conjugal transfer protein TrbH [Pararhizobium antarcticum]|uniref:Conjugal transfer protein TrbH n=1 Tax=Pararhizobium antarcticum TaxID=1798805 RepID=A0A657LM57_9HYPH|nr:conjugal transfer protein TrbH [Pararhizobium antarcticum]OJF91500.1 conjugal transfer protein TrbH [Pararhizobium antarcticum]OJF99492.1 conjugal transfer protein TrbH [Rhizobium sp. 58]